MAELNFTVDPTMQETSPVDPVPAGDYIAIIETSTVKPTKDGQGKILALTYQIIEGPFAGKKVFENLNIVNKNQQAQQIALSSLNELGKICGLPHVADSSQLHAIPLMIRVTVDEQPGYSPKNVVKRHFLKTGESPSAPQTQAPQTINGGQAQYIPPSGNNGAAPPAWAKR